MARGEMRDVIVPDDDAPDDDASEAGTRDPHGLARTRAGAGRGDLSRRSGGGRSEGGRSEGGRSGGGRSGGGRSEGGRSEARRSGGGRSAGRPERRRTVVLVAALTAAVVVAGVQAVQGAGDDLPGALDPLTAPPAVLWRHPAGALETTTPSGDVLVGRPRGPEDRLVQLVDTATGRTRWTAALPGSRDAEDVTCVAVGPTGSSATAHIACRLVEPASPSVADLPAHLPAQLRAHAVRSRLVVLDAETGERVADRVLTDRFTTVTSVGTDLIRVELLTDRHVRVTREHAVTGAGRWTFRSPRPVRWPGPDATLPTPVPSVQHDVVVVADGPAAWALTPGGTLLAEWLPPASTEAIVDVTVLPDGRYAVTETAPAVGGTATSGTVSDTPARNGFAIGRVLEPVVDDGTAADLLLTRSPSGDRVLALDPATGGTRWRALLPDGDVVVLGDRLIAASVDGVTSLDASTGRTVWRAQVGGIRPDPQLVTDGRVVVVLRWGPAAARRLTALDARDGTERWTVAAPDGTAGLRVVDGRLLARTPDEVVALGRIDRG